MEHQTTPFFGIKQLAEDERPREKMKIFGGSNLSYAELLAILIGSGNKNASALQLAQEILRSANNNLSDLSRMTISDLTKIKGIGPTKAIILNAALELGKRRREEEAKKTIKITCSKDAFGYFEHLLEDYRHEEFWLLLLNRNNIVLARKRISIGGVSGTVVDPKVIFKIAIDHLASSIILCHNHPSGNLNPSRQDIEITKKLKEAGKLLEIDIYDHIIIGNKGFFSLSDNFLL
ncbi:MAG: DNA repair protein RadC [Bacteroidia bacterium]|nr:DNA repair protein RadC [Bacteroidia bacterium]MCF8426304.1 DNA repair protein RadC [Bacteroidia bacterium]MCF8446580.1 DNA repair protein RadC [Bacteroidia bacterium]